MSNQKLKCSELSDTKKMQMMFPLRSNLKDLTCCIHTASAGSCWHMLQVAVFPLPSSLEPDLLQGDDNDSTTSIFLFPVFKCESAPLVFFNSSHPFFYQVSSSLLCVHGKTKKEATHNDALFCKCNNFTLIQHKEAVHACEHPFEMANVAFWTRL